MKKDHKCGCTKGDNLQKDGGLNSFNVAVNEGNKFELGYDSHTKSSVKKMGNKY